MTQQAYHIKLGNITAVLKQRSTQMNLANIEESDENIRYLLQQQTLS
jgi:hypothetical protein